MNPSKPGKGAAHLVKRCEQQLLLCRIPWQTSLSWSQQGRSAPGQTLRAAAAAVQDPMADLTLLVPAREERTWSNVASSSCCCAGVQAARLGSSAPLALPLARPFLFLSGTLASAQ